MTAIQISRRALLAGLAAAGGGRPIVVGSKIDTEGALLGALMVCTLRAHGLRVEARLGLGPTRILRQALLAGAIDLYPEYTGNAAAFWNREGYPVWHDAAAAAATARLLDAPLGLVWLTPAPADNGWGIAVRPDLAEGRVVRNFPDFTRYLATGGRLFLAASVEFAESANALAAFERAYGFHLTQDQLLLLAGGNTAATLRAAAERISGVNAAMAYGTDGALDVLRLILLADPKGAQAIFQPAPVIRAEALARAPDIPAWLAPVFARLDAGTLRHLNAAIGVYGNEPDAVASAWLRAQGLPA